MRRLLVAAILSVALLGGTRATARASGNGLGILFDFACTGFGPCQSGSCAGQSPNPYGYGPSMYGSGSGPSQRPNSTGFQMNPSPGSNGSAPSKNKCCCLPQPGWSGEYTKPKMYDGRAACMPAQGGYPSPYPMQLVAGYGQGGYPMPYPMPYAPHYGQGSYPAPYPMSVAPNYGYAQPQGNYGASNQGYPWTQQAPTQQTPATPGISTLPPPTPDSPAKSSK